MSCSKYTLTNTGTTAINFNYRRCDDSMWEYQVNLNPNETKNIWLIDNTFSISPLFTTTLELVNNGPFPLTPTPTGTQAPTPTPTGTQTPTPTPTSSSLPVTPTPTSTAPVTPTPTSTAPVTPTPTPTSTAPVTPTPTPTSTAPVTPTPTGTVPATPTPTGTAPVTPTTTVTPTNTSTTTPTQTNTPTTTTTSTPTPSPTPVYPGSIDFNGGFFTVVPGFTAGTQDFSVEFWINATAPYPYTIPILGQFGTEPLSVAISNNGTTLTVQLDNSPLTYTLPSTLPSNSWTYFALSRSGTTENVWMGTTGTTTTPCGVQIDNRDYTGTTTSVGFFGVFLTAKLTDLKVNVGATYIDPNLTTTTIPTSSLTSDAETVMLYNVNTSGTFLDDSSGTQTINAQSGVSFSSDSPY
jgi:hypothetical protein